MTKEEIEAKIRLYVDRANRHATTLTTCQPAQRGVFTMLHQKAMDQATKYIKMLEKLNES